jgi:hypothetical protein
MVNEEQILQLLAYIRSLAGEQPGATTAPAPGAVGTQARPGTQPSSASQVRQ